MNETQRLVAWGDELVKLHDSFRRDLTQLRATGSLTGTDLRTHCLAFCDRLDAHHEGEDGALFPHLHNEHSALAEVLDRLRAEHHVVAQLLEQIRYLTDVPGDGLASALDHLADKLEAHLDYEEEQLVPVLNQLTTLPDNI